MQETDIYRQIQTAINEIENTFFTSKGKKGFPPLVMAIDNKCKSVVIAYVQTESLYDKKNCKKLQYLGINPQYLDRDLKEVLATIAHELCHVYENEYIHIPRNGYHDKKWEDLLKGCGLEPKYMNKSKTSVSTVIPDNSCFTDFVDIFRQKYDKDSMFFNVVSYSQKYEKSMTDDSTDRADNADKPMKKYNRNKIKYVCPSCSSKVWGKPNLNILCSDCNEKFEAEDMEETEN